MQIYGRFEDLEVKNRWMTNFFSKKLLLFNFTQISFITKESNLRILTKNKWDDYFIIESPI